MSAPVSAPAHPIWVDLGILPPAEKGTNIFLSAWSLFPESGATGQLVDVSVVALCDNAVSSRKSAIGIIAYRLTSPPFR